MQLLKKRSGQGTLEYVLIIAAVLGLAMLIARTVNDHGKPMINAVGKTLDDATNQAK